MPLILLLIVFGMLELWVMLVMTSQIGIAATLGLVLLTALLGMGVVKRQGFSVMAGIRDGFARQELPGYSIFEGVCLLIAGLFLFVPGFITDIAGFLLLIPRIRQKIWVRVTHEGARRGYTIIDITDSETRD